MKIVVCLLLAACSSAEPKPAPVTKPANAATVAPAKVAAPAQPPAPTDDTPTAEEEEEGMAEGGINQDVVQLHTRDGKTVELWVVAEPAQEGAGVQKLMAAYDGTTTVVFVDDRRFAEEQYASVKVLRDGRVELWSAQQIGHLSTEITQRFRWDAKRNMLVPSGKPIERDKSI